MASSANASLVPDDGGGPRTSIAIFGKEGSTSLHVLLGFATNTFFPEGLGIMGDNAKKI